jgi:hypothetical protein
MDYTDDIATVAAGPTAWAGRPCSGQAGLPVGAGNGGHVEITESAISTRLLEVISKPPAGNARTPRKRPFSDFHGHFHGNAGWLEQVDIMSHEATF